MSEATYFRPYCPHGVAHYIVCGKCELKQMAERREERLYEILDKLAGAIDRLAEKS